MMHGQKNIKQWDQFARNLAPLYMITQPARLCEIRHRGLAASGWA